MNNISGIDRVAQLAHSVRARVAVAESLTAGQICAALGAGGPGDQEGQPPGTVFIAVSDDTGTRSLHAELPGDPPTVVAAAIDLALEELARALRRIPRADDVKEKPNAS